MALILHRAPRADALADGLAELLRAPLADPFATEVVVVPAKGMERWLSQRLAHRLGTGPGRQDGVCAGVDFRTPRSLVAGLTGTDADDPWGPDALAWPVLEAVDASLEEPWAVTLAAHLGHGREGEERELRRGRRFSVARRLAALFASYAVQRPALLADWSGGRDSDGCGRAVAGDLAWQPELWRRVAALVGAPTPAERHASVLTALGDDPAVVDLPERVSLFGHTRLPVTEVELLDALARHRDVHLWLPHPSPALWEALAPVTATGPLPRAEDRGHELAAHPLLASLGRDLRELQRALAPAAAESRVLPGDPSPPTLLGWLQADLAANRVGPASERPLSVADRSVQVHACHGLARQVEVLREVLLGLLADDTSLEPRDVLVMCPDIEALAPLVSAGFGLAEVVADSGHPAHRLRVRLADRSLTQTNPLLGVVDRLLALAGGRAKAGEVLDLAHALPVRRRFRFSDDDLQQLADWVREAGIRWAFDAGHRADYGLADHVQNTWRFGLDRLLVGAAMSADADAWLDRILPLDDVGSGQVDLAGRLAEYADRLRVITDRLTGSHPLDHWLAALTDGVAALTDVPTDDAWQAAQVQRELGRVRAEAQDRAGLPLRLPDIRALLDRRLAGRPTRANFRSGTLTVCTMVPMRSVPHRVVCLVGLDDGAFPRVGVLDGDDVLARDPLTGERAPRSEDRQLLLDAILAATEVLVVTYSGADEHTGRHRPPAVPLGELLDTLDLTATAPRGGVTAAVSVQHPLQPHDVRNLEPGALTPGRVFTFDPATASAAAAASGPRAPVPGFASTRLPLTPPAEVELDDLTAFLRHPVKRFLRRLDVALPWEEDEPGDALPVEVAGLGQWNIGERLLADLLVGVPPQRAVEREWRRGVLPPGRLGWRLLQEIAQQTRPLAAAALERRTRPARSVDVDVDLGDGRRLSGTVPGVYGDRLVPVSYSRLGPGHRLQSWARLLALSLAEPDHSWTAHTIGRPANSRSRDAHAVSLLGPVDPPTALAALRHLVDLADRGLREPLPLPVKASFRYAQMRRTQSSVDQARDKATRWDWEDGAFPGEVSDVAHVRVWGPKAPLPGWDQPPRPGEEFPGETSRFGALSLRLWSPLLVAEPGGW